MRTNLLVVGGITAARPSTRCGGVRDNRWLFSFAVEDDFEQTLNPAAARARYRAESRAQRCVQASR